MTLRHRLGDKPLTDLGRDPRKERRTQDDAGEDLAQHGRLPEALRDRPQDSRGEEQDCQLDEERKDVIVRR